MITQPYPSFIDPEVGGRAKPVSNGTIFIGQNQKDPIQFPEKVYYKDSDGTEIEMAQPIHLNSAGVTVASKSSSTVVRPYTKSASYSILIRNSGGNDRYINESVSVFADKEDITDAQNEIIGGSIFKGSNGEYVENGDTVPAGSTHIRAIGGDFSKARIFPVVKKDGTNGSISGVVSNLNLTVRPYSATIGSGDVWLLDCEFFNLPIVGIPLQAFWCSADTDENHAMAQACFDYCVLSRTPCYSTPYGMVPVEAMLTVKNPVDFKFFGVSKRHSGIVASSTIDESSPIPALIRFEGGANFIDIENIKLDGNNRVIDIVDFSDDGTEQFGSRVTNIVRAEISGIRHDGIGLRNLSWDTKVFMCDIKGYGISTGSELWEGTGITVGASSNGVWIDQTYLRRLTFGIVNEGFAQYDACEISKCIFDNIKAFAVYGKYGCRRLSINNNYFESVNDGRSVTVPTPSGGANISSQICLAASPSDANFSYVQSLDITCNNFIGGNASSVVALSSCYKADVLRNNVRYKGSVGGTDKFNEFVQIFGYGTTTKRNNQGRTLLIEGNDLYADTQNRQGPSVDKILSYRTELSAAGRYLEGIVVKDTLKENSYLGLSNLMSVTPLEFFNSGTLFVATIDPDSEYMIKVEKQPSGTTPVLDLSDKLKRLKGEYIRLELNSVSKSTSFPPRFTIDDGVNTQLIISGAGVFEALETAGSCNIFYIDPLATKLTIAYSNLGSDSDFHLFESLNLIHASCDVGSGYN